jgi:hypothetical protein
VPTSKKYFFQKFITVSWIFWLFHDFLNFHDQSEKFMTFSWLSWPVDTLEFESYIWYIILKILNSPARKTSKCGLDFHWWTTIFQRFRLKGKFDPLHLKKRLFFNTTKPKSFKFDSHLRFLKF